MKRILVTGGAGFIGSHVVDALLASGYQVVVLDDFSTGSMLNLPCGNKNLSIVAGNILDAPLLYDVVSRVEAIVHLAAIASVQQSVDETSSTHKVNFDATLLLLETARACRVDRVVFASSAAVYGDSVGLEPIDEFVEKKPLTPYAIDKLSCEHYLAFYQKLYKLDCTIFRFFNVFGERQNPLSPYSGVISIFCEKAFTGKEVVIYGDGRQVRDFVYVRDVANLLVDALSNEEFFGKVINVGTGRPTSLLDLVACLEMIIGKKVAVVFTPARQGDIHYSLANVDLLRSCWGKIPISPIEAGLRAIHKTYSAVGG